MIATFGRVVDVYTVDLLRDDFLRRHLVVEQDFVFRSEGYVFAWC